MLEYSRNVRFLGRKDLMKVTHSMLEYRVLNARVTLESSKNVRAN